MIIKNKLQIALFIGGALCGTIGSKILKGKDAKRGYAHIVAAALRAKDEVVKCTTALRENCADVLAQAREINERREAEDDDLIIGDSSEQA